MSREKGPDRAFFAGEEAVCFHRPLSSVNFKPSLILILMEFRDYIAILSGLVVILATFIWTMWMLVQQINKRIDLVEKRIDDLREDIKGLREEIKEIRRLLYKQEE